MERVLIKLWLKKECLGLIPIEKEAEKRLDGTKRTAINTRKEWAGIYLKQALDRSHLISYIYSMKEVHIKVSNISPKQWANLLLELNLVKSSWRRFGPDISIKAQNFNKIVKWGTKIHGEDTRNIDFTFRRNAPTRKIRPK